MMIHWTLVENRSNMKICGVRVEFNNFFTTHQTLDGVIEQFVYGFASALEKLLRFRNFRFMITDSEIPSHSFNKQFLKFIKVVG